MHCLFSSYFQIQCVPANNIDTPMALLNRTAFAKYTFILFNFISFPFFLLTPPLRRQIQEPVFLYSEWRTQFPNRNHSSGWSSVFTSVAVLSIKQKIKVRGSVEQAKAVSLSSVHMDGTTRLCPTHPEKQFCCFVTMTLQWNIFTGPWGYFRRCADAWVDWWEPEHTLKNMDGQTLLHWMGSAL